MQNRVAFLIKPKTFEIKDIEIPTLKPTQMLIRIKACGICLSEMPTYLGKETCVLEGGKLTFPRRLGHEPAGVVKKVGDKVEGFKPGDKVTGMYWTPTLGHFAEYAVVDFASPQTAVIRIPDNIPVEYGIGEPMKCCATIARYSNVKFGDYVFVAGCGFMGLLVIAGLASKGLGELIACDLIDSRLKLAKELGATITLNPKEVDIVKEVESITDGQMCDVAIEGIGHPPGVELTSKVLKKSPPPGIIVLYGSHYVADTYNLCLWGPKAPMILSIHPHFSFDEKRDLKIAIKALEKGIYPVEKLITHKFKLEDIGKGFEAARTKLKGYIKGIVTP